MIRILIDDVSSINARKGNRRKRMYTIEILNYVNSTDGSMGYSAWLHDQDGYVIKRARMDGVAYPETNALTLLDCAIDALKGEA